MFTSQRRPQAKTTGETMPRLTILVSVSVYDFVNFVPRLLSV